jgi:prevent-host-death family protein
MDTVIPVSRVKAEALAIVERVASTGEEVTITKRGKPVARLVAAIEPASLLGSVRVLVSEEEFPHGSVIS